MISITPTIFRSFKVNLVNGTSDFVVENSQHRIQIIVGDNTDNANDTTLNQVELFFRQRTTIGKRDFGCIKPHARNRLKIILNQ